ncbi:MAG TPA: hypothetical protein VNF04_18200 [Stellaceae bacterium]|nr:hypothetical protein [Stellaceae bacterium]
MLVPRTINIAGRPGSRQMQFRQPGLATIVDQQRLEAAGRASAKEIEDRHAQIDLIDGPGKAGRSPTRFRGHDWDSGWLASSTVMTWIAKHR